MKNTIIAVFSAMMMLPVFGEVVVSVNEGESAREMIQKSIDSLPKEGGSIFIPAGRYELDGMVHINRSNVTLR